MKSEQIQLTQGKFALVDRKDYEWLMQWKWAVSKATRGGFYAKRVSKRDENGKQHNIYMHREILGAQSGQEVDHISGESLDNRRSNLRLCTHRENLYNSRSHCDAKSRFKGVTWDKSRHKWMALIYYKGKQHNLGRFDSEKDAALAYNRASTAYHGKFARLNFFRSQKAG